MKPESPHTKDVEEKLAAISWELFLTRCLLIFVAICAGLPLFAPQLATRIAAFSVTVWRACSPHWISALAIVISLLAVIFCAAYLVGRTKAAPPALEGGTTRDRMSGTAG